MINFIIVFKMFFFIFKKKKYKYQKFLFGNFFSFKSNEFWSKYNLKFGHNFLFGKNFLGKLIFQNGYFSEKNMIKI